MLHSNRVTARGRSSNFERAFSSNTLGICSNSAVYSSGMNAPIEVYAHSTDERDLAFRNIDLSIKSSAARKKRSLW